MESTIGYEAARHHERSVHNCRVSRHNRLLHGNCRAMSAPAAKAPMALPTPHQLADPGRHGLLLADRFARRVPLEPDLGAVARARDEVDAAIRDWDVAVDPDVALLLTSELVTNAVTHGTRGQPGSGASGVVILASTADETGLRVEVHDGSASLPVLNPARHDAECGRGLLLVSSLSAEWGYYRTPAGKAVYFTLKSNDSTQRRDY